MKWNIKTKDNKVYVTLTVTSIKSVPQGSPQTYTTDFVMSHLEREKICVGALLEESTVFNYQTSKKCEGTWIFSLPLKPKTKKPTKPVEKKEIVSKITNKKTIKK